MPLGIIGSKVGIPKNAVESQKEKERLQGKVSNMKKVVDALDEESKAAFIEQYESLSEDDKFTVANRIDKIYREHDLKSKSFVPQFFKGLYESVPFGKRAISFLPEDMVADTERRYASIPPPTGKAGTAGRLLSTVSMDLATTYPFLAIASTLPIGSTIIKTALGLGGKRGLDAYIQGENVGLGVAKGAGAGLLFGTAGKVGSSIMPKNVPMAERLGTAGGFGGAGALMSLFNEGDVLQDALFSAGLGFMFPVRKQTGTPGLGRASKRKVLRIRDKTKAYHKRETDAYGKSIENLGKESNMLDARPILEHSERIMVKKGMFVTDAKGNQKIATKLFPEDRKLAASYERLLRLSIKNNGKIPQSEVVKEYQSIKGSHVKKPTPTSKARTTVANDFFEGVKPQIKSEEYLKANRRYFNFKRNEEAIDKYFDIWGSENLTGKGEQTLFNLFKQEQSDVATIAGNVTGERFGGFRAASRANQVIRNPLTRWAVGAGLLGLGAREFGKER
jgi:hypothetical protein